MEGRRHLVPQHARQHDVALLRRRHLVAPLAREFEGDAADALDLERVVDLRVDPALLAVAEVEDLLRFAEIDAARQFPQDHDVEPLDQLALQRGGIGQRRIADGGPQVGVEREILAQAQQAGLGPHGEGHAVPFGAADGAEQHGVGGMRQRDVGIADRRAMRVIGRAADEPALDLEGGDPLRIPPAQDLLDLGQNLGADAVAGQEEEF